MLLIASKAVRGNAALNDVVREMSLSLSFCSTADELSELARGPSRCIVLLTAAEFNDEVIGQLRAADEENGIGVLVAANKPKLQSSDKADLMHRLVSLPNVEWIGETFDFEHLAASARHCRRRMLRVSSDDLHRAFDESEFLVRYQPKVEREDGSDWVTKEAEALVRWRHPDHGMVGPLEFLPEVEEFGLMGRLTEFVLQTSAAQLCEWQEQGLELKGCVNLPSSLLSDETLADRYAEIVREFGLDCQRFTFEIVERDLASPEAPHLRTLKNLRAHGFRISLDDFRVAASSMCTLEQLPIDEIKLHISAVKNAQNNTNAMHVLAAVSGLAHNLGMSVCAEGVEDQETFDFLATIDCDKMQGFLISEAVVPDIIQRVY
ncbi:MAG: EAL domain-containing protein, partial [Gammaproteobacteria bacterium]|nr:EAL domain-containing protein [Gammaproteobacteria bacterium]